ncbi:uncharacterized protein RHOBADRAFT_56142 [Rhodotorula graminis WP1]|uniref:Myb-like domain-containing protein n=1 Tax=Rhodotorula graminis (strain WP1) TaxID=578459 RepID=A0A0P9GGK7_RHOGW|nr:uncharacterized protein RHOBADRAFT_56142 [Rhodotorula graminis WP1]KPV72004.1 hypothetical protein RHOBADRAFT_56142 [Rhodotorula graminis WP1]
MADTRRQTTTRGSASTTGTASGSTAAGPFTSVATPSGNTRTPRASRAVVAAASSALSLPGPPPLPTTAATTARTRATTTPRPSAPPPPPSQLVRTPGNLRTQKRLARDAPWRPSLIGGDSDAARKLAERRELVRGPVNAALEELLMVGRDEGGEDNGQWAVGDDARTAVQAFQALKTAYLSPQEFLDASSLQHVVPHEIANPKSPTNTLIRLSNLTTFLNLILTSAPDQSGVADRTAVVKLKTAGDAFLRHVLPEDMRVDDQVVKLIIDIKCQVFLLASSLSRAPLDSMPFFSSTLSQLLPASRAYHLTDRGATARFLVLQSQALDQIWHTGNDWVVLRTKWRWDDLARDARDWVERCVTQSGLGVGPGAGLSVGESSPSSSPVGQGMDVERALRNETEDEEEVPSPPRAQDKGKGRAVVEEQEDEDDDSAREGEEGSRVDESVNAERYDGSEVRDDDTGGESLDDGDQAGSLDLDTDLSTDQGGRRHAPTASIRSSSPSSSSSDADEVARALVASASPTGARSSTRSGGSSSGPQAVDGTGQVDKVQETLSQSDLVMRTDSLFALGTFGKAESAAVETTHVQESLAVTNPESDRADDLLDLLGESLPDDEDDALAEESASVAPSMQQDVESDVMGAEPAQQQQPRPQQATAGHIRFDSGNRLVRDPAPKLSRPAFLERQPDARKINFDDSQSQDAGPAPRSSAAQQYAPSPEAARAPGRRRRSASASGDEPDERFSPVAGPSRAAAAAQGVEMEPYLEQEFGGGYDDDDEAGELPVQGEGPLFRRAPSDDRSTAGFAIDDDFPSARQASSVDKRTKAVSRDGKGKGKSHGAVVDREDSSLPRPSLQARLAAYPPSQHTARTSRDDAEPSRSSKSQRRSPPRASGYKPPPTQLSSDDQGPSGSDDSGSSSDDSVDIPVPSRSGKGKKRAVDTASDDDSSDESSPPARKKSHNKHASRTRSPSPPLPLGAAGNNYFQGRNLPGLRVAWTRDETDLLVKLLREVGCDWARMIKLHGPKGTRTKTFRHRTNVALKDKAVNLKMGYMRRGAPVPPEFQHVTMPRTKMPKLPAERAPANETDEESS